MRPSEINTVMRGLQPEQRQAFYTAEKEAGAKLGHVGTPVSDFMSDAHRCSCGWVSAWYWDGDDLAYDEWLNHIIEQGAEITYPMPA